MFSAFLFLKTMIKYFLFISSQQKSLAGTGKQFSSVVTFLCTFQVLNCGCVWSRGVSLKNHRSGACKTDFLYNSGGFVVSNPISAVLTIITIVSVILNRSLIKVVKKTFPLVKPLNQSNLLEGKLILMTKGGGFLSIQIFNSYPQNRVVWGSLKDFKQQVDIKFITG